MVDNNVVADPNLERAPGCSNSSMVDNNICQVLPFRHKFQVQIPLWSIITLRPYLEPDSPCQFKFLYGR